MVIHYRFTVSCRSLSKTQMQQIKKKLIPISHYYLLILLIYNRFYVRRTQYLECNTRKYPLPFRREHRRYVNVSDAAEQIIPSGPLAIGNAFSDQARFIPPRRWWHTTIKEPTMTQAWPAAHETPSHQREHRP